MHSVRVAFAALGLMLAGTAQGHGAAAQDDVVYGLGQSSCRSFATAWQHMQSMHLKSYLAWLDGYLSARGTALSHDLKANEGTWELMPWLVKYCDAEPNSRFETAADALVETLRRQR